MVAEIFLSQCRKNNQYLCAIHCMLDNEPMETRRKLQISTGPYYWFGGGIDGEAGYIGMFNDTKINRVQKSC